MTTKPAEPVTAPLPAETPTKPALATATEPVEPPTVLDNDERTTPGAGTSAASGEPHTVRSDAAEPRRSTVPSIDLGHAPERLALAATRVIGPRAAAWAHQISETYPAATGTGIARLAIQRFTRRSTVGGALAGLSGSVAPTAALAAAAWSQAELVLHIAAAYGHDPTSEDRAVDLLVVAGVHPTREHARAALASLGVAPDEPVSAAALRFGLPVIRSAAGWTALRAVNRRLPGLAVLVAALTGRAAAERLGTRAISYYRDRAAQSQENHSRGSSA